jgi:hypothetical protein
MELLFLGAALPAMRAADFFGAEAIAKCSTIAFCATRSKNHAYFRHR